MGLTLFWLQAQACSGNTMSLLNAEEPDLTEFITRYDVDVLYHPSLSPIWGEQVHRLLRQLANEEIKLDIFVVEGAIPLGPNGTGLYNTFADRPIKDIVQELAAVAEYVVAVGDCATHGGFPAMDPNPTDAVGLQYLNKQHGGLLGAEYRSRAGLPVVNITGCPAHPDWQLQTLMAIAEGLGPLLELDEYARPRAFYGKMTHTGCTNNEYYDHKHSVKSFTQQGCLFFDKGCRGPYTHSDCNVRLWNRQSSKTRVGSPCLGCTDIGWPNENYSVERPFYSREQLTPMREDSRVLPYGLGKIFSYVATPAELEERKVLFSPEVDRRPQNLVGIEEIKVLSD
ncbi:MULTISPECIES: NADH-quinone oxidoreductase subunit B family protein [Kyrpidia]|uniref:Hydrogenase small subunit n=3 Tax=Kyrpidia spormannii TaxID=2055160 RepID=A0ACA8Z820_9BACL|nr:MULTISPECIES: hydrogenase [Kyrpidia]MCL6577180.1 hydrogenase [Kyrpidia sp.]CAB3391558.1 Hydrogenase small subunit [Kyrpidia spormannii]CAB3392471.1 Hydrogenase [Kyrpidia spormannii]